MSIETEHKYLINKELWAKVVPDKSLKIVQAYLHSDPEKTIRIRTKGVQGYITIKGKTTNASRPEYEYEIPIKDALEMIGDFAGMIIEKTRHYVKYKNKTWEVDVFEGLNSGLIMAEIELSSEDETYSLPPWITENVTADARYYNASLAQKPFTKW
jgi:CYTH domain-containing protein